MKQQVQLKSPIQNKHTKYAQDCRFGLRHFEIDNFRGIQTKIKNVLLLQNILLLSKMIGKTILQYQLNNIYEMI